jgi:hypothetical protein
MAPATPPLINPSLQTNGGDDGAAGVLASATSAGKKQGSGAPRGPKVSNNFKSVPARRNPARGAKFNGGVAESEAAGGSPRKKPQDQSPRKKLRGAETFLRSTARRPSEAGKRPSSSTNPTGSSATSEAIRTIGLASPAPSAARRPSKAGTRRPSSPEVIRMIGPASPTASTARPKAIRTIRPASPAASAA